MSMSSTRTESPQTKTRKVRKLLADLMAEAGNDLNEIPAICRRVRELRESVIDENGHRLSQEKAAQRLGYGVYRARKDSGDIAADERTNSVLLGGHRSLRLRLRALVAVRGGSPEQLGSLGPGLANGLEEVSGQRQKRLGHHRSELLALGDPDLLHRVRVARFSLHRLGGPLHVHEDVAAVEFGDGR